MSQFTADERKKSLFRMHLKNHLFEYILDIVGTVVCAVVILKLCKAEDIWMGAVIAFVYALGRMAYQITHFKKEFIDVDVEKESDEVA